jgi:uncharacterized protein (UPF0335 family)
MNKPLKFDDAKIHADEAPKKIPNSGDVKGFIDRIHKVMETLDEAKADLKALYSDAKDQGIDTRALKVVVVHKKRPMSTEFKQEVNLLLEKSGQQIMFAFV